MTHIIFFDLGLFILLIWGTYRGFSKGLIIELASLIALALGIYGGLKFSGYASGILKEKFVMTNEYLPLISFGVTFLLIVDAVFFLAKFIETIVNVASLKLINKMAGALFGLLKTGLLIIVFLMIAGKADEKAKCIPEEIKNESLFYKTAKKIQSEVTPLLKEL